MTKTQELQLITKKGATAYDSGIDLFSEKNYHGLLYYNTQGLQ